jgi:hypothetical protein
VYAQIKSLTSFMVHALIVIVQTTSIQLAKSVFPVQMDTSLINNIQSANKLLVKARKNTYIKSRNANALQVILINITKNAINAHKNTISIKKNVLLVIKPHSITLPYKFASAIKLKAIFQRELT